MVNTNLDRSMEWTQKRSCGRRKEKTSFEKTKSMKNDIFAFHYLSGLEE